MLTIYSLYKVEGGGKNVHPNSLFLSDCNTAHNIDLNGSKMGIIQITLMKMLFRTIVQLLAVENV